MKIYLRFKHLTLALLISIMVLFTYLAVQQNYRTGANDPQIQLAEYMQANLKRNVAVSQLIPPESLDLETSLAVFFMAYDPNGKLIITTGLVDGKEHPLPPGTLTHVTETEQSQFTWQPKKGVRLAMTVIAVNSSKVAYLAIGRSLKEIERRESNLLRMTILAWLLAMSVIAINLFISIKMQSK